MIRRVQRGVFTVNPDGTISAQAILTVIDDDGDVMGSPLSHRMMIAPGDSLEDVFANNVLPNKFAFPPVNDPEWKMLKDCMRAIHTLEIVVAYQDKLKVQADQSSAERVAAGVE